LAALTDDATEPRRGMQAQKFLWRTATCALLLTAALAVTPRPASAGISLEGGAAVTGGKASAEGALSLGLLNLPLVPLAGELTVAVPFDGGYATTFDARLTFAGTAIGAGAGFGTLGATNQTGAIYDALLAHGIAPHTALEARLYFGPSRPSTLFAGVRFSL
jgi:hypothetical protein